MSIKQNPIWRALTSRSLTLALLIAAGIAIGAATFVEAARGTDAARLYVYNAIWFEGILLLLGINLAFTLERWWPLTFSRIGFFFIHVAVIVILVGAAATRHLGYEGVLALRKGSEASHMVSKESYLKVTDGQETGSYRVHMLPDGPKDRVVDIEVAGRSYQVEVLDYWSHYDQGATDDDEARAALRLRISTSGERPVTAITVERDKRDVPVGLCGKQLDVSFGPF